MTLPFVTVILPVRNEGSYIEAALRAVISQTYPKHLIEVIIADGMSDDQTREIIQHTCEGEDQQRVRIIDNPGKIVPVGMNLAIREAAGEVIVRVDGHCVIAADYVERCVAHLLNDQADGVGGPMETIGENPISETIAVGMSSPFGVGGSAFRTINDRTIYADTVPFPAYKRATIDRAGLYDEELVRNQDDEYNYRIRELGGRILLAQDVHSVYYSRGSLKKLWKQYFQYGFYKVRILQKHPQQMSYRQFIPPLFVSAILVSVLLALFVDWGWMVSVLVGGLYLLLNLLASLLTARKRGWQHFVWLPVVYAILHLSYGFGFLSGLAKFANRWSDRHGKVPEFTRKPAG